MIRILALATVAALLVVPSSSAFAVRGASSRAPGHEKLSHHGASSFAPGQEFRKHGSVPGHPGASGYAPGRGG